MINVTEDAKKILETRLSQHTTKNDVGLRLVPKETGKIGLAPDKARKGDQIIKHSDRTLLLVGKEVSDALDGMTLLIEETEEGTKRMALR